MKTVVCPLALTLALVLVAPAQSQETPAAPTWEDKIAKGFLPYHQLTVDDFKIDDQVDPKSSYVIRPFLHPHWEYVATWKDGWHYAYIVKWLVFSGFDKNVSSRKSKFKEMKRALPSAQAYLDLYEIHARQLAALLPGELPSGRGATPQEARVALEQNLDALLKQKYQLLQVEADAFVKATNRGTNEKKVRELGKAFRKRLDAIPAATKLPSKLGVGDTAPEPNLTANRLACFQMKEITLLPAMCCLTAWAGFSPAAIAQSEKPMMKAVVVHEYGGPQVLKYEDAPRPEPKENEVLVRVIACGVNPADPLIVSGKYAKEFGTHLPLIPGYDVAGVVEKTGAKVTKLKAGDGVYGYALFGGGWAEYALLAENEAALKPKSLSYVEAAAVPLAALTAWQALIDVAQLRAGQTVLIHGGSGGVGSFAVQIAKARGARVIATASTPNQDLLKQLGADVAIDYTKAKFEEIAKEIDVVLDPVGRDTLARSYGVVKKGGIITTLVARCDPAQLDKYGIRGASISVKPDANELAEIARLIEEKKIKPIVTQVLPLSEAVKAHDQAATKHTRGKIVLKIADEPKS